MGAYLTVPNTEKVSSNDANIFLEVGASSMQGWRYGQEDAHNCILDFDDRTSFFSVYDGHGGAEVATYCAAKLGAFLKEMPAYKTGNYAQALQDVFLAFDRTLLEEEVIDELKRLAEKNPNRDSEIADDEEEEDLIELCEEGALPLDQVLEKYKGVAAAKFPQLNKLKQDEAGASGSGVSKPLSPFLRGRRNLNAIHNNVDEAGKFVGDAGCGPSSSTSSAGLAAEKDASPGLPDLGIGDSCVSSSCSKSNTSAINSSVSIGQQKIPTIKSNEAGEAVSTVDTNGTSSPARVADSSSSEVVKSIDSEASPLVPKKKVQNGDITSSSPSSTSSHAGSVSDQKKSEPSNGEVSSNTSVKKVQEKAIVGSISARGKPTSGSSGISSSTSLVVTSAGPKAPAQGEADDSSSDDDADFHAEEDNSSTEDGEEDCEVFDDDSDEEENEDAEDEETEDDEERPLDGDETAFCHNMIEEPGKDSGCTAVVTLINGRDLYVANAGDSRCVVSRNGKAVEMSIDHKPEDEEESDRIQKAGGKVTLDGRVNGGLNLSRALGDHAYKLNAELPPEKQMISALPDVKQLIISPEDEFMILACDGIWNFMSSDEVVGFVKKRLDDGCEKLSQICEELFDHCLAPNTMGDGTGCDNMTAVLVRFKPALQTLPTKIPAESVVTAVSAKPAKLSASNEMVANNLEDESSSTEEAEVTKSAAVVAKKRPASPTRSDDNLASCSTASSELSTSGAEKASKRLKTDNEVVNVSDCEVAGSEVSGQEGDVTMSAVTTSSESAANVESESTTSTSSTT